MHSIIEKEAHMDSAQTECETELITIDESVVATIKERLKDALGRRSKAFELEVTNVAGGSFYEFCHDLSSDNDVDFINKSQDIAELLASSQTRPNIPGGYLIIIEAVNNEANLSVYIVIKAELHQALKRNSANGRSQIELLDKIFLSPSQKLFKIGILYEKNRTQTEPNLRFGCLVFDDQFRNEGHPAEYFYQDFLGFSIDANAKIQSKRFYEKTASFIKSHIPELDEKLDLLHTLKAEFTVSTSTTISPSQFANDHIIDIDVRDEYLSEVSEGLPSCFVKDSTLIDFKLRKKNLDFPDDIKLAGPESHFDENVKIIQNNQELSTLDPTDITYTLVKINGKPFDNE